MWAEGRQASRGDYPHGRRGRAVRNAGRTPFYPDDQYRRRGFSRRWARCRRFARRYRPGAVSGQVAGPQWLCCDGRFGAARIASFAPTGVEYYTSAMAPARPVLLFDVMSTLVTEPFLDAMPRHFGMTLDEFKASRDPQPWIEFEHGRITEAEYVADYFLDGTPLDVPAFKAMLFGAYEWMDGVEPLLVRLHAAGYRMYALSNYSVWYEIIEDKLGLSRFMGWDFVSCRTGHRKPDPEAYLTPIREVGEPADAFIFIDDRPVNVEAARAVGMKAILRTPDIAPLIDDLTQLGVTAARPT